MIDPIIIFQRTQAGRDEIQQKSHGLTQSERLVLIMIDGVTACQGVRSKLPVLSDERFERALAKLLQNALVCEVLLPLEGIAPEQIDSSVVDRFLQQDPLDPLTVMFVDPDEHFGDEILGVPAAMRAQSPAVNLAEFAPVQAPEMTHPDATTTPVTTGCTQSRAMNDEDIRLADSLAEEVRARNAVRPVRVEPIRRIDIESDPRDRVPVAGQTRFKISSIHWGYWLMGLGFAFIAGFYLARLSM